jgi:hypothetical protein
MTGCLTSPAGVGGKMPDAFFGRKTQSQLEPQHGETFGKKCPLRGVKSKDMSLKLLLLYLKLQLQVTNVTAIYTRNDR